MVVGPRAYAALPSCLCVVGSSCGAGCGYAMVLFGGTTNMCMYLLACSCCSTNVLQQVAIRRLRSVKLKHASLYRTALYDSCYRCRAAVSVSATCLVGAFYGKPSDRQHTFAMRRHGAALAIFQVEFLAICTGREVNVTRLTERVVCSTDCMQTFHISWTIRSMNTSFRIFTTL